MTHSALRSLTTRCSPDSGDSNPCSLRQSLRVGFLTMAIALIPTAVRADEAEIEVAVSTQEIFIGESIDYQVEIRNVEDPAPPDVSALKEQFDVVPNGDQSRNQSSTFIINGRVSQQTVLSHIYLYRLTPKVAGDLTIPAVKATVDGMTLSGRTIELRVQNAEKQDLVLAEVRLDHSTVYPTQPFTVTVRVLVQPLPQGNADPLQPLRRQPPHLQINWLEVPLGLKANQTTEWLQPLISEDGTGFTLNEVTASTGSFFGGSRAAVFDLASGRETRNSEDGEPIEYFVYELSRTFTAEKTGRCSFGPALVKGRFVDGMQDGEYRARRLVAVTPAANLEIREVPSPRPENFFGGIGEYLIAASASPVKLRVGDPLTLTLEFARGSQAGSLELISAPDLTSNPEIAENFEIIDKAPTGRIEGDVKKFGYAMRPKRPDVSIPSLTLTTFNPEAEDFTAISTEAISLEVSEASQLSGGELVGAVSSTVTKEIRKSSAGIFQNISDPSELRDERVNLNRWLITVAGFWCVAGCVIAGVTIHRRRSADTAGLRRIQARRAALAKLNEVSQLMADGKNQDALRQIRSAFMGLVADVQNRVTEGLTTADVGQALAEARVPNSDRAETMRLLESIEGAEYGGGNPIDVPTAAQSATAIIDRISPLLERSGAR